ncbi:hypothetical protein OG250_20580 [Streptomyces sp. NBC_00487]|uniref:hypothetical protein n=1 Tax=unclassified Streptomyces TaxID=2593676 RepID=UPI002DDC36E3|nr:MULTISPECIES: hypothetical protein [unclassified Streptomyces]WRY97051.1 hypothetical protein OG889_21335 [Streptomyces sp. NBC_00481]
MVRKLSRGVALAASLAVLPLMAACSGGGDKADGKATGESSPVAAVVAPAKVEVIAELTGCEVKIRTEAEELREGVCQTAVGDYLITTFPKDELKEVWLESASIYGGKYLVGPQWAISAKPAVLKKLKVKVGGTIRDLSQPSAS